MIHTCVVTTATCQNVFHEKGLYSVQFLEGLVADKYMHQTKTQKICNFHAAYSHYRVILCTYCLIAYVSVKRHNRLIAQLQNIILT